MWNAAEPGSPSLPWTSDAMNASGKIILLSPAITARMKYITRFISGRLGYTVELMPADRYKKNHIPSDVFVLNYSNTPLDGCFNIFSHGLMLETGIRNHETGHFRNGGQHYLYPAPKGFNLPFDLFSACFFMLSRYEEYQSFIPDQYGRFEADQSLAFQKGFLEEPIVDQWIRDFKKSLQQISPFLVFPVQEFRFISSFDIDNPWAFRHKGFLRNVAGSLKALWQSRYPDFQQRLEVIRGATKDPFDTYEYIINIEAKYNFKSIFFFLFGDYDRFDSNYARKSRHFKNLVQEIGKDHKVGVHPSLRSNDHARLLPLEYKRYSEILDKAPEMNRQHFLILHFPATYRRIIEMGIREDYSMGYASNAGFRAGTSIPFIFYDLAAEFETDLVIHPFAVMDVTLQQYLSLTPHEALERIISIAERVKQADGTLVSLWHNESLSEQGTWKGWRAVFEGMIEIVTRDK